ncbi:peptidase M23 [Mycobacterium sp. 852013-50091_SCH5140682]|nr:peptidase M23 [Mycobacterium sp. 852013-50091_SCH5140682]
MTTAAALATATLLTVPLAACSTSSTPVSNPAGTSGAASPAVTSTTAVPATVAPVAAQGDADWKPVADVLGRTGKLSDHNTVYRIPLTRTDLHVQTGGVDIAPGLSLGGYAAFVRYPDTTMVMGDLVVTEDELSKVTDALHSHGIAQTALHKHQLAQTPPVWWTHIQAMGDPATLATGLRDVLATTAIPGPTPPPATAPAPAPAPALDLNTAAIDAALGRTGTADGGLYKFTFARADTITDEGHVLPPGTGVTTAITFQPFGGGKAAINGDFALTDPEIQPVITALRAGHIAIVELHNHMLTEQPRLFFLHYWAVDDAATLATALRPALDATHLAPAPK